MAEFDIVAYLATKGHHGKRANGPEVAYNCFFDCDEPEGSRKRKLYVNVEDGFYTCFVCGAAGGTYLLQKHFGEEPAKPAPGADPGTKLKILSWAADVGSAMLLNNEKHLLYLMNDRGLSAETIIEARIGWVGNNWSLTGSLPEEFTRKELDNTGLVYKDGPRAGQDFFYDHLLIPYQSRGQVVQIRGRATHDGKGGKYLTGPGEPVRLYGLDDLDGADDVVIVEGEFDRLALRQHLRGSPDPKVRRIAVVGLAGANGFKEGFESYLKDAKRIYVALDPDDTGKREGIKIKDRLGARGRIVELPAELPKCDWTEFLLPVPADADSTWRVTHPHAGHTWRDVVELFGAAAGRRVFSIRDAANAYRRQRGISAGLQTGLIGLDKYLIPGCLPGQVMIVLAKTGTGKTNFLCNLAVNMRQSRGLIISLEMTREEVYDRLQRIYRFYEPLATDYQVEEALANIYICDENRLSDRDFVEIIEEYRNEVGAGPEYVMVDYLGYFARGQKGNSQYEKVTNAVMQLKAMAKADDPANRFFLISPAQVNRMAKEGKPVEVDDARDSGAIEETADFLLSLWRPDDALSPINEDVNVKRSGKLKISILKSRHGNKDQVINVLFDQLTLAIVDDDGGRVARKVEEHNHLAWRGDSYAKFRAWETRPIQMPLRGVS